MISAESGASLFDRPRWWFRRVRSYPVRVRGVLVVALLAGVLLRLWVLRSPLGVADLDEATVGLQARDFLEGHLEAFFPAQSYGGTAETALVAGSFGAFGSGWFALKVVPVALHLSGCLVLWRVARQVATTRAGQLVAPIVLWIGSAHGVWQSTKERGFYGAALLLAAVVLLLVVRLDGRPCRRDSVLLGLVLGLGIWTTPLLVAAMGPPVIWLLLRRRAL